MFIEPQISSLYPAGCVPEWDLSLSHLLGFLFGGLVKNKTIKSLLLPSYHKKYQELSRSPTVSFLDKEGFVVFLQNTLVMARVFV